MFSPDAKGEVDSQGNISALCDTSSKKICQISITPLIFEEDSWKGWSSRWILPNSSKRYTKVLKGILPTLKEETYIFEMFSRENSKSFRFSIKVRKRLVEVVETFEGQADEVVVAASGDTQKTKAKTTPKTTKTPKTSAKTTATKTTKTSSGSTASTASKTKTSSLETGTKSTEDNNIKVLLLFAASILSFGLGLSISRLFLPERGKWISSGNSDEDS